MRLQRQERLAAHSQQQLVIGQGFAVIKPDLLLLPQNFRAADACQQPNRLLLVPLGLLQKQGGQRKAVRQGVAEGGPVIGRLFFAADQRDRGSLIPPTDGFGAFQPGGAAAD